MKPIELHHSNLSEQVYTYIKRMILSGEIRGGERIPEERVGQLFGVSRTPIREALKRLSEYGLVHIKPRSYAVVVGLTREETTQLACVRAQLETLSARLLSEVGSDDDFDYLEKIAKECDILVARGDVADAFEKDSTFHLEIAKRSKNRHLYEIYEKIDAKIRLSWLIIKLPLDRLESSINQHRKIIKAMRTGNPVLSEDLMKHHILHQLTY